MDASLRLENIDIVLCRPRSGGNIGSAARAVGNMGLGRLVLVATEDFLESEARMMAASAGRILRDAASFATLSQALAGYVLTLAVTRRRRSSRQRIMDPREAAAAVVQAAGRGRVALVFGPEDSGLSGEEVSPCHGIVSIPTADTYPSLNLAQAVMVLAYEARMTLDESRRAVRSFGSASERERHEVVTQITSVLQRAGFFLRNPRDRVMLHISEILSSGVRTSQDARILRGAFRRIAWALGSKPENYRTGEQG